MANDTSQPRAQLLLIGDELLAGEIADRNGPYFAAALGEQGYRVDQMRILPDDAAVVAAAVRSACDAAALTIVCGGLGPTSDDRTTEAVAAALGVAPVLVDEQWQRIRQMFMALRGSEPPPGNEKQAMIPAGAAVLPNANGTAIGYVATAPGGARVAVFPGPPRENQPMWRDALLPMLQAWAPQRPRSDTLVLRTFGLAESAVGARLADVEAAFPDIRVGYQFRFPEVLVKFRADGGGAARARAAAEQARAALAPHVYGEGDTTLAAVLGQALAVAGKRVVTAESCTGGWVGKLLTDVPGASAFYDRSFVVYTNTAKREVLRVPRETLQTHGAVSEPTALAMLVGALEKSAAQVGLAITGIAGPGGGTADKPVGTVCIAWGDRANQAAHTYTFRWDREYNRLLSACTAMARLLEFLATDA